MKDLSRNDLNFLQDAFVKLYVEMGPELYKGVDSKDLHAKIWYQVVFDLLVSKGLIKDVKEV